MSDKPIPSTDGIQPVNLQIIPADYYREDDEFNLYDIFAILFRYRFLMAAITAACTIIALLYALLVPPEYKASVHLSVPALHDINELGLQDNNPTQVVFQRFLDYFNSRALRWQYFEEHNLLAALVDEREMERDEKKQENLPYAVFEEQFNNRLRYEQKAVTKRRAVTRVTGATATLQLRDPVLAADWLNGYVQQVHAETVDSLKADRMASWNFRQQRLDERIDRLRRYAETSRADEIARLLEVDAINRRRIEGHIKALRAKAKQDLSDEKRKLRESLEIARTLDFVDMAVPAPRVDQAITNSPDLMVNLRHIPTYSRGVKALEAEIHALNSREEFPDPFVSGLRDQQRQLAMLNENARVLALQNRTSDDPHIGDLRSLQQEQEKLEMNLQRLAADEDIKVVTIEQAAVPPQKPSKPKRKLVVLIGLLGGVILAVFAAFMLHFLGKYRQIAAIKPG